MGTHTVPGLGTGARLGRGALAVAVTTAGAGALAASLAGTANAAPVVHDGPPTAGTLHLGALAAERHGHHSHRDRGGPARAGAHRRKPRRIEGPGCAVTAILHDLVAGSITATAPGAPTEPAPALPTQALLPLLGGSRAAPTPQPLAPPAAPPAPPAATRAAPADAGAGERGARRGRADDHPDPQHLERPGRTHDHSHPGLSTPGAELSTRRR